MRINKKWLKQRQHAAQFKIPKAIKENFAKAIANGDVPSQQQIKMAVDLGVVKRNVNGNLDVETLSDYFKTFVQQRKAERKRNSNR